MTPVTAPTSRHPFLPPPASSAGRNAKSGGLPDGYLQCAEHAAEPRDEGDRAAMHVDATISPRDGMSELPAPPDLPLEDLRILRLLADGRTNPEIAKAAFFSVAAVRSRVVMLCPKLGTANRVHAAALGVVHRLVTPAHLSGLPVVHLAVREIDRLVLVRTVTGATGTAIAKDLGLSEYTVRDVLKRLRQEFCAHTAAQLAATAVVTGAVTCRAVDPRFPNVPLSELPPVGRVSAECGR